MVPTSDPRPVAPQITDVKFRPPRSAQRLGANGRSTVETPDRMSGSPLGQRAATPPVWLPLAGLASALLACEWLNIDLAVAGLFYGGPASPWPLHDALAWLWFDHLATLPGLILGNVGLVLLAAARIDASFRRHRRTALFIVALLALGPGLLVNVGFKTFWGRPRPYQIAQFDGELEYRPVWSADVPRYNSSFPSGHAALGFFLMAPAFLAWDRRRVVLAWMSAGLTAGALIGFSRVVQGRHFVSDVLGSLGVVYFSAVALYYALRFDRSSSPESGSQAGLGAALNELWGRG